MKSMDDSQYMVEYIDRDTQLPTQIGVITDDQKKTEVLGLIDSATDPWSLWHEYDNVHSMEILDSGRVQKNHSMCGVQDWTSEAVFSVMTFTEAKAVLYGIVEMA